ncbi:MAG TPA: carbohydrate ABC transporter permease, partial [Isoptericola sp.]|nr:carbohydrate ABC transporter permease [Isoptericola sp.]
MTETTTAPAAPTTVPAPETGTTAPPRRRRRRVTPGRVLAWAVMIIVLLVTLFPFYWMLRTALSSNGALYANSTSLLPVDFSWGGFERVFGLQSTEEAIAQGGSGASIDFWLYLRNSV